MAANHLSYQPRLQEQNSKDLLIEIEVNRDDYHKNINKLSSVFYLPVLLLTIKLHHNKGKMTRVNKRKDK